MIELNDLTMSYALESRRLNVLSGVDLAIADGETVAIIGPSGSGKTTLLILLAGLEQPERGEIRLDGAALSTLDADGLADMRRDKLGIIFQSFHLVPSLTALANVALPLDIAGRPQSRERAREMLVKVGLAQREDHYPSQLSGGEQQRVAIARALVHAPKLVLADEPTGNLDLHTGEKVSDLLFDLNREAGATLLMVTHDEAIAKRCSRVLRLHEGKLVEEPHALPA
ncbi:ABC transporter ATP-binding protein [Hahella sp. HN01]|uniref:ABC transporter ATP-binding protein n=1 Tax=Hahella sp. HN01 TaxID=2847262 RepID=UPI001C1EB07B|nr:ABC transporter ATP-binding protein [Hahella sp. HN01]MBU6955455.1 ABC transporter ATP-binding protein [Hahella sp. HN01]